MEKSGMVNTTTWCFGHEDLVKTESFTVVHENSKGNLFIPFDNFKISQREQEVVLPKFQLKS
jgi:hypothetical protein